jgi:cobalamin-dependent methionine synthase I
MLIIANNITTRNPKVARIFRQETSGCEKAGPEAYADLQDLALSCVKAGADVLEINLQQHLDVPGMMEFAIKAVQQVTQKQLCLSTRNASSLEAGLKLCECSPIINYITLDINSLKNILPHVAKYKSELILLISDPARPADAREMLEKAAVLVGAAGGEGISPDRIFLDPGIFHITTEQGQKHLVDVINFLRAIPEAFDPPIRTTCWLSNSSAGAPARLRPFIETALLACLSSVGLTSVFFDVLRRDNIRTAHLLKIFNNEEVYADSLFEV